jgi:hypothetical protein
MKSTSQLIFQLAVTEDRRLSINGDGKPLDRQLPKEYDSWGNCVGFQPDQLIRWLLAGVAFKCEQRETGAFSSHSVPTIESACKQRHDNPP